MAPRGVPWPPRGVPWPLCEDLVLEDPYYIYSWSTRHQSTRYTQRTHAKFHRCRPNSVRENRYNFYTLHFLGASGGPPGPKFTSLGGDVQEGTLSSCQISSPSDNPSTRYLLPKFVDFVDGLTARQTNKNKE